MYLIVGSTPGQKILLTSYSGNPLTAEHVLPSFGDFWLNASLIKRALINEPYTPEDNAVDYFDEMPMNHQEELHQFQLDGIEEIRKHDKKHHGDSQGNMVCKSSSNPDS